MNRSFFLTFALAVVAACVPQPRVAVTSGFDADDKADIARAVVKWNTILKTPITVGNGEWKLVKETPPEFATRGWVGETLRGPRVVFIKPDLDRKTFYAVVLHELGHVAGLHHIAGPGVMNPNVGVTEFTDGDIEECRQEMACPLSEIDEAICRLQGVCR